MKWQKGQKGTTLLELLVGVAIVAMIGTGLVALIDHEVRSTAAARACVTAADEIENAARWISKDGMMAESSNLVDSVQPVHNLDISWIERYDFANVPHNCAYFLSDNELCRDYDGVVTTVARHISGIKFSQTDNLLTVKISCTPPWIGQSRTVEKTYRIYLRTAGGG